MIVFEPTWGCISGATTSRKISLSSFSPRTNLYNYIRVMTFPVNLKDKSMSFRGVEVEQTYERLVKELSSCSMEEVPTMARCQELYADIEADPMRPSISAACIAKLALECISPENLQFALNAEQSARQRADDCAPKQEVTISKQKCDRSLHARLITSIQSESLKAQCDAAEIFRHCLLPNIHRLLASNHSRMLAEAETIVHEEFASKQEASKSKKRCGLPQTSVAIMKEWVEKHFNHPYPSDEEKLMLADAGNIEFRQVENWMVNYRGRVWKRDIKEVFLKSECGDTEQLCELQSMIRKPCDEQEI